MSEKSIVDDAFELDKKLDEFLICNSGMPRELHIRVYNLKIYLESFLIYHKHSYHHGRLIEVGDDYV